MPDTCLPLRASQGGPTRRTTLLDLAAGVLQVPVAAHARGTLLVQTEAGLTQGASGGFRVAVEPSAARTEAFGGAVETYGEGRQVAVAEGFGNRVAQGQAPGDPVALLRVEGLRSPDEGAELLAPRFDWVPTDEATEYLVAFGADPGLSEVLTVLRRGRPGDTLDDLTLFAADDHAWWQVTPVDVTGFVGVPTDPRSFRFPRGFEAE